MDSASGPCRRRSGCPIGSTRPGGSAIAADVGGRHVDDRADAFVLQLLQPLDDAVPERGSTSHERRPGLEHTGRADEDVLVWKRESEPGRIDRATNGLYRSSGAPVLTFRRAGGREPNAARVRCQHGQAGPGQARQKLAPSCHWIVIRENARAWRARSPPPLSGGPW